MSAVDMSCFDAPQQKVSDSGAGEMHCLKPQLSSSSSHFIVSEVISNILDNVFEIMMANDFKKDKPKIQTKITPTVVGDILDNIISHSNDLYQQDETVLLDDEIKKIIKEMKFPPPDQKCIMATKGVGDQLGNKSKTTDRVLSEPVKRNTLERKNRLTNLVKSSKQMFAKLVTNENSEIKTSKSEEIHEKLIKVVDFESYHTFAEPGSSGSATGILNMPAELNMDTVDLKPDRYHAESNLENRNPQYQSFLEPKALSQDQLPLKNDIDKKENSGSKKKWNFGAKVFKYFRKHHSRKY